jgi:serine/threonine-protein kinase
MASERWSRIEETFKGASVLRGEERAAFLERECVGDAGLLEEVRSLLDHDEAGSGRSIAAAIHGAVSPAIGEALTEAGGFAAPGETVGSYRIVREIGRGGMGTVYLAVRADDQFSKQVAIKVMRTRRGRPDLLQRFQTERQILATLEHPNIARMLDGGSTDAGEPYVVMEYVEGQSLDTWCNQRRLGTSDRLRLFRDVCAAVQYAHRNLIIHRDLKPGNILVTEAGEPKLLDFGIAKLLNPELSPVTIAETATEFRMLTPEYASPEQVKGEGVSTATDVYGLGVVLYELLTGRRPYRLKRATTSDLEKAIVEQDPERPSTAITRDETSTGARRAGDAGTIGRERGTLPDRLRRQLTGDLDNIVLMALRKEPARRYPSAEALSEDIRRHLEGLPVSARPSTFVYRTRKFLRRNAVTVTVTASVLAAITMLVIYYTVQLRSERDRAQSAEQRAVSDARIAAATSDFLSGLFETADPRQVGNRHVNAQDLLYAGLEKLRTDESLDPKTRADLRLTLGLSLSNLGDENAGVEALQLAVADFEKAYGHESLETAEAIHRLGDVLRRVERFDEGLALLREALAIRERLLPGDSYEMADSYNNLAIMLINLGGFAESDRLQTASVEMHMRLTGGTEPGVGVPVNNLSLLKTRQGRLDEGEKLSTQAFEMLSRGTDRSSPLLARFNLALIAKQKGRVEEALDEFSAILDEQLILMGPGHQRSISSAREIAACLVLLGRFEEARGRYEELLRTAESAVEPDSRAYADTQAYLADLLLIEGNPAGAERLMREVIRKYEVSAGPSHFAMAGRKRELAEALIGTGKLDEARSVLLEALELLPRPGEYPHIERARLLIRLSRILRETGREEEAAAALDSARGIIDATSGAESLEMGLLLAQRAALEARGGHAASAAAAMDTAALILRRYLPEIHPDRRELGRLLAAVPAS